MSNTKAVALYEDNAGQLTIVYEDLGLAFTGLHFVEKSTFAWDARGLLAGEHGSWTVEKVDPEGDYGEIVARFFGDEQTEVYDPGTAGRRYLGLV